jgi:Holliday junction resolvase
MRPGAGGGGDHRTGRRTMGSRAGRHTTRKIRAERWRTARRNLRVYAVLALLCGAPAGLLMVWPMPQFLRGLLVGLAVASFAYLVAYSLMLDGSHQRMAGADAERWTARELRKLDGWWVIDSVMFDRADVDHVAVGPNHVLAVETKWTSRPLRIDARRVDGMAIDPVAQTRKSQRKIQLFLKSEGLTQPVIPVLVLWGPGVPKIDGGYQRIDDVRVVVGLQAREWRSRLDQLPRWSSSTTGAREAFERYVDAYDARRSAEQPGRLRRLRGTS